MKYYSLGSTEIFAWEGSNQYGSLMNHINMTKDAILYHGRFCQSGLASKFSLTTAMCVTVNRTSLSNDVGKTKYAESPLQCSTNTDKIVLCEYYDDSFTFARFSLPCDCGYDN